MPKLITTRTRIADLGKPRIIVIGGGFAGLEFIKRIDGRKFQTVLFNRFNHHTFQPLLYQIATSGLETHSIIFPFRKKFWSKPDFFFRLGEVTHIKPEENLIETSIGSVRYDYLVIATGVTTNYYGMADVEANAIPMKSVVDAIKLRNRIIRSFETALLTDDPELMNSLIDFVIVGGGPTGVELAGSLSELKRFVFPKDYPELEMSMMDVHLVEAAPRLLSGMSERSSAKALQYLQEMGVKVHLNCTVKSYDGHAVRFNTGEKLITRTLIWAAGVRGNPIPGLATGAIGKSGRIIVDACSRVKGHENIFAIGDIALMEGDPNFVAGHPQTAPPAIQQGRQLARNFSRWLSEQEPILFRYRHVGSMATVGRNHAVVDLKGLKTQGFIAWCIWMFVHLMSIVGYRNRVFVFFSWLWSYFSYDKSNRIIISRTREGI
jgi:NADH dehydrogenase